METQLNVRFMKYTHYFLGKCKILKLANEAKKSKNKNQG